MMTRRWTKLEERLLLQLWEQGVPSYEIGDLLKRTGGAVEKRHAVLMERAAAYAKRGEPLPEVE